MDQEQPTPAEAAANLNSEYILAEQQLLAGTVRLVARTGSSYNDQLNLVTAMRRLVMAVAARLGRVTPELIDDLIDAETKAAEKDAGFDFSKPHGVRAVEAIRADLTSELTDVRRRITRLPDDVFKLIAPEGAASQTLGTTTVQAQQQAYTEFIRQGVTGFTDRSGRRWALSSYVEMAVRTASQRAFNASHLAVIQATGNNLVTVSDDGHPCPLCLPWQGKTCCIVADGQHPTIEQAIAAGLMHPNCRHHWTVVVPGVTHHPEPREWTDDDQDLYEATQKQRGYERAIRASKRQLEYSRNGQQAADARKDIRDTQAKLRAHTEAYNLKRRSRREQPNLALK